jgi:integrase
VKFYATEREAKELKTAIERMALTIPMAEIRRRLDEAETGRGQAPKQLPSLREAITSNLERLERTGELRGATLVRYRSAQRLWVPAHVGALAVDRITRKMVGEIIETVKSAGKSNALIDGVRHPIKATFARLIADGTLPAEFLNPGAELGEWIGRKRQKKQKGDIDWFPGEQGIALLKRCEDDYPRRYAFLCTGMLAGLRWGESVALELDDIEWDRGTIYVQRTWSEKGKVIGPLKDCDKRRVPLHKELRRALRAHLALLDAADYKATGITCVDDHGRRSTRRARLMFPNTVGKLEGSSGAFYEHFWTKMQREAGMAQPKKYHSTRHTFATGHRVG